VDAQQLDLGHVSQKGVKSIERLAAYGLKADEIAESLGEEEADVKRIMRKRRWNLEMPQKISVLALESDLSVTGSVDLLLHVKKKPVARGSVPLRSILAAPNAKHSAVVSCMTTKTAVVARIELDMQFRMYALKPQVAST